MRAFFYLFSTGHILAFLTSLLENNRDRDAKRRWANNVVGGDWGLGIGGIGGKLLTGAVKKSAGKFFG